MLSTFTTKYGTLIIPTANIRRIEDVERPHETGQIGRPPTVECLVQYAVNETELYTQYITGTARENLERLQREELEAIAKVQQAERRMDRDLPPLPIVRGGRVRG